MKIQLIKLKFNLFGVTNFNEKNYIIKKTIKLIRFIFYRGTTLILDINNVYLCTVCYSLEIGYKVNIF